jgi:hypothetical protein
MSKTMTLNQTYRLYNLLVILVLVLAILYVFLINLFEIQLTCQNKLNNIPCENCGVTRGLYDFFQFKFSGSFDHNPKSFFLGVLIYFQLIVKGISIWKMKSIIVGEKVYRVILIEICLFFFFMIGYKLI